MDYLCGTWKSYPFDMRNVGQAKPQGMLVGAVALRGWKKQIATSNRCSFAREFEESLKMGKQMTVSLCGTGAPIDDAKQWDSIDWQKVRREVRRLQMRIAKAVIKGNQGKVKSLQWILAHSLHAKALAVKRVTSNKVTARLMRRRALV
jgi:N-terminal domain of reverse transcriptase